MKQKHQQRGGTILGFVMGLVLGLAIALVVAVYVTKVPVPFLDRGLGGTVEQDAAENKKNQNWDPNAPLYGKNPVRPANPGSQPEASVVPSGAATPELKPAVTADPLGDLMKSRETAGRAGVAQTPATAEPFVFFVQVGAFRTPEDAESQRAKLSLAGMETKVTEREQAGRKVYRVRMGPFDNGDEAEKVKARLDAINIEAALVRVQR